jgi:hypothetical protein
VELKTSLCTFLVAYFHNKSWCGNFILYFTRSALIVLFFFGGTEDQSQGHAHGMQALTELHASPFAQTALYSFLNTLFQDCSLLLLNFFISIY